MLRQKDEQIKQLQEIAIHKKKENSVTKGNENRLRMVQLERELEMSREKLKKIQQEGPDGTYSEKLLIELEQSKSEVKEMQYQRFEDGRSYDNLMQSFQ